MEKGKSACMYSPTLQDEKIKRLLQIDYVTKIIMRILCLFINSKMISLILTKGIGIDIDFNVYDKWKNDF